MMRDSLTGDLILMGLTRQIELGPCVAHSAGVITLVFVANGGKCDSLGSEG